MSEENKTIVSPQIEIENMRDEQGRPKSFSLVETFATMELGDNRKVEVVRWVNGMGFEIRYPEDDPKHPGGQFGFGIKPLFDVAMAKLEGES